MNKALRHTLTDAKPNFNIKRNLSELRKIISRFSKRSQISKLKLFPKWDRVCKAAELQALSTANDIRFNLKVSVVLFSLNLSRRFIPTCKIIVS